MNRLIVFLLPVLFFTFTIYGDQGTQTNYGKQTQTKAPKKPHVPPTFIDENSAALLLKKYKDESTIVPNCPDPSNVSQLQLGYQDLGITGDMPDYIDSSNSGVERKSRIDIWETVIPSTTAYVKYCYYTDPDEDYIFIYLKKDN